MDTVRQHTASIERETRLLCGLWTAGDAHTLCMCVSRSRLCRCAWIDRGSYQGGAQGRRAITITRTITKATFTHAPHTPYSPAGADL